MNRDALNLLNAEVAAEVAGICARAGAAIMEIYQEPDVEVRLKADQTPVTAADFAAHRVVVDGLRASWPEVPVLSEESGQILWSERQTWRTYWLVDPLDGTKEFVKKNDDFTVNVALIQDGEPVMGVIFAPVYGLTYWAARGLGAFKVDAQGSAPIGVSSRQIPRVDAPEPAQARPLTIIVSRSHITGANAQFMSDIEQIYREPTLLRVGSSLKLCMIADGRADVYPRMGPTSEWDIAAGQCILEQAGGVVEQLNGQRLRYNKQSLLNPHFVARSPRVELPKTPQNA